MGIENWHKAALSAARINHDEGIVAETVGAEALFTELVAMGLLKRHPPRWTITDFGKEVLSKISLAPHV